MTTVFGTILSLADLGFNIFDTPFVRYCKTFGFLPFQDNDFVTGLTFIRLNRSNFLQVPPEIVVHIMF